MKDNNIFGDKLRKVRMEHGYTQKDLARAISVCHQSISKWESGVITPQVRWVYVIAKALEVNPQDLI